MTQEVIKCHYTYLCPRQPCFKYTQTQTQVSVSASVLVVLVLLYDGFLVSGLQSEPLGITADDSTQDYPQMPFP